MMGFFDKVKKAFGSKKEEDESQNSVNDEIIDKSESIESLENDDEILNDNEEIQFNDSKETLPDEEILDEPLSEKIRNFKYLDDLIHSGAKEIVLDSDIILSEGEESKYRNGIKIDVEIAIDGNGHSIDAINKTRIFDISSRLTLKNITLKNGAGNEGGAIHIRRSGSLNTIDSNFIDNTSNENGGAIFNHGLINLHNTNFINNATLEGDGGAVYTKKDGTLSAISCEFNKNTSNKRGGAIYNDGKTELMKCKFRNNASQGDVLFTQIEDDLEVVDCEFEGNANFEDETSTPPEESEHLDSKDTSVNEEITDKFMLNDEIRNFKYLDCLIHSGIKEIVLDSDIILSDGEESKYLGGIELDVDGLIIDGNGHAIDACGKTRIFFCEGKNITIKNIELRNGHVTKDGGGAILNMGGCGIVNSKLENNMAQENYCNGGAVRNTGKLWIAKSTFAQNTSEDWGGAIDNDGVLEISQAIFNKNAAKRASGAICNGNESKLIITKSAFVQNTTGYGGAIENYGELKISESTFSKNMANDSGGAISNVDGTLTIRESMIDENTAKKDGGAIQNYIADLTISYSTISKNTANREGGVIQNHNGSLTITESNIEENTANYGVITNDDGTYVDMDSTHVKNIGKNGVLVTEIRITESIFSKNVGNMGVIINKKGSLKIFNCQFSSNKSLTGIIDNQDFSRLQYTNFYNNRAKYLLVNKMTKSNLGIIGGQFIDNNVGDAIILNIEKSCTIEKSVFENNLSNNSKNIINEGELTLINPKIKDESKSILNDGHVLIKRSSQNLLSKIYGKGIVEMDMHLGENKFDFGYLDKKIRESLTKGIILDRDICLETYEQDFFEGGIELDIDNLVIDGKGKTIDGAGKSRIFLITGHNIVLKNITFKNGLSHKNYDNPFNADGGAIKVNHKTKLTLKNCKFVDNDSEDGGGAIHNDGRLEITKSSLSQNKAYDGGAISNKNFLKINESTLIENTAEMNGGAIHNDGILEIIDSSFDGNIAQHDGGAIGNKKLLRITGSALTGNAAQHDGGAVYNNRGELTIIESTLTGNTAQGDGGAVYNLKKSFYIKYCKLENNNPDDVYEQ